MDPLHAADRIIPGRPAPIVLRDYQERACAAVLAARDRGLHRVMVVMPTGTGKTTLFAALVKEFAEHYREPSMVVAHRSELLQQAADRVRLVAPQLKVGIEGGAHSAEPDSDVVVAGVQTIGRPGSNRLGDFHPGLLIVDEGHHAPADTWMNVLRRYGAFEGTCFTLAVTATDHRMDNRPLHGTEEAIFEDVVFRYNLRDAVRDGWLVSLRGYRVATGIDLSKVRRTGGDYNTAQLARTVNIEERNGTALMNWESVASDRRTIVFCVDVQHAKDVAEMFRARGVGAEHVDGTLKPLEREAALARFRSGRTQVLTNVDIATEGFDLPRADCVLMLRPTQSWALYTQMVGRGLRVLPGVVDGLADPSARRSAIEGSAKPDCIVIDVVDLGQKEKAEPNNGGIASAAGLVGLPDDFDLQGRNVFEAADKVDALTPVYRAELFRRPMAFDDLDESLSEVDLLSELEIPEQIKGVARLAWMKVGPERYYLACGSNALERDRWAELECDELGRYHVRISSDLMGETRMALGSDRMRAFDQAEKLVRMSYPDVAPIVRIDARWRDKPPTPRQLELLRQLGMSETALAQVNSMGSAKNLLERLRMRSRER